MSSFSLCLFSSFQLAVFIYIYYVVFKKLPQRYGGGSQQFRYIVVIQNAHQRISNNKFYIKNLWHIKNKTHGNAS